VGLSGDFTVAFAGEGSQPTSLEKLVTRMDHGEFDLIAVGRALLGDPEWVTKIRAGADTDLRDFNPAAIAELV
jgi:2,4-dienoyl-CoA reductase-like NADH-dependent reductase (Old Yellow Enzyme family)